MAWIPYSANRKSTSIIETKSLRKSLTFRFNDQEISVLLRILKFLASSYARSIADYCGNKIEDGMAY